MGLIALEGMHFYAYHGFYEEEQVIGNEYVVDIVIDTDFTQAITGDRITKTINYETVFQVVQIEMRTKSKLLEHLAGRILLRLKSTFDALRAVTIRIYKITPVIGGKVERVYIEETIEFTKRCPRCGNHLLCYEDGTCWCHHADIKIFSKTREMLSNKFGGCLCKNCLMEYAS